jgi:hypothetical protein
MSESMSMSSGRGTFMSSPLWGTGLLLVWLALWCGFALALLPPPRAGLGRPLPAEVA